MAHFLTLPLPTAQEIKDVGKHFYVLGGSPGLVVMGVYSRSKGRGFKSRRRILHGHDIFHIHLL